MSWQAHLQHTETGLALTFAQPVSRLDMSADVAAHLASLLAVEARHRLAGVVRALGGDRQNAAPDSFLPRNMPIQVIGNGHPLCCDCDDCLHSDGGKHHA